LEAVGLAVCKDEAVEAAAYKGVAEENKLYGPPPLQGIS